MSSNDLPYYNIFFHFLVDSENEELVRHLGVMKLIGGVIGKAVYGGVLVNSQLCITILNSFLGRDNTFDDLVYYDKVVYQRLLELKQLAKTPRAQAEIAKYGLTFEVYWFVILL